MIDIHMPLIGWFLVVSIACAAVCVVAGWKFGLVRIAATIQCFLGVLLLILYLVSWSTRYDVIVQRHWTEVSGIRRAISVRVESKYGGVRLEIRRGANWNEGGTPYGPYEIRLRRGVPGKEQFLPLSENDMSFFKCGHFEKITRFQLCLVTKPDPPKPLSETTAFYSVTVPHWFAILFPWVPFVLLWYHRYRRRRYRLRHGLCLSCSYDLRESPEKCPECGTPRPSVLQPSSSPKQIAGE